MPSTSSRVAWLIFIALGFAWGSSYLFIKIGVETLTPFTLIAARLAIGTAVLTLAMAVTRQHLPRSRTAYRHLVVVALLGVVIPFGLITWGEQSIDSALAAILNGTVPLFAIVLAALLLADEPMTLNRVAGLLLGFAGLVALVGPNLRSGFAGGSGELALVGASVSYAAAGVYARWKVRDVAPLPSALLEVGYAFVITLLLAFAFETPLATRLQGSSVLAIVWLGLVGSGLAFMAYFWLLSRWGATRTSMVAYLIPVVGILLGVLVRNETVTALTLVGTAMVIGGVALANSRYGHRRLFGRTAAPSSDPARGGD
jgi:drug/metabolite transporter (DMT)-like permease